ncbi:Hpt domain-containing protein [Litorisediminicola beolgyonensis]|uniref:Hpt domain-containing protein n=1 Tax=Litorisediminicola beolgyonensis TaxID=1173614 RepID=A0ABW3ZLT9_9RHOB
MIDWVRVAELRDDVGADGFDEVVEIFLDEMAEALAVLDVAVGAPDRMAAQMHFLKGGTLNLGFRDLARACSEGEVAARDGRAPAALVTDVRSLFEASRSALFEGLSQGRAA